MSQEKLIEIVSESSPVTDEQVEALDLGRAESELLDAIMGEPAVEPQEPSRTGWVAGLRRRRFVLRAGAALAGAAAAAALFFSGSDPGGDGTGGVAYAAEWIRIAENNPRLLVTAPGWEVTRADEYRQNYGEMTFSDGNAEVDLHWYPIDSYAGFYRDRAHDADETRIDLLDRTATLFDSGFGTYSAMFRPGGETFVEIRGDYDGRLGREAFLGLLDTLEAVDVETWLAALPPSVVRATDRSTTVDAMLEGIPLPPGLDVDSLKEGETARDRYQLGALVTGAVTCAWLEQRMSGLQAGDRARVREAEEALATARAWPILLEMRSEGAWSDEVWDWAEDGRGSSGFGRNTTEHPGGALGCRDEIWRGVPHIDPVAKARALAKAERRGLPD